MKLLFLGSHGSQSTATLAALLAGGLRPDQILVHREGPAASALTLPVLGAHDREGPCEIGAKHGIAVAAVGRRQLAAAVRRCAPDLAVVSCYPFRIPEDLLSRVPHGWVNVHPSALPAYAGPAPVFWQLRDGARSIGVTLHRMARELDRGPILDQTNIELHEGAPYSEIAATAGSAGGEMIGRLLRGGPERLPAGTPQPASPDSWRAHPAPKAFEIGPAWGALRIFNFVRGVRELGAPVLPMADGRRIRIDQAVAWSADNPPVRRLPERAGRICVNCYDGNVTLVPCTEDPLR